MHWNKDSVKIDRNTCPVCKQFIPLVWLFREIFKKIINFISKEVVVRKTMGALTPCPMMALQKEKPKFVSLSRPESPEQLKIYINNAFEELENIVQTLEPHDTEGMGQGKDSILIETYIDSLYVFPEMPKLNISRCRRCVNNVLCCVGCFYKRTDILGKDLLEYGHNRLLNSFSTEYSDISRSVSSSYSSRGTTVTTTTTTTTPMVPRPSTSSSYAPPSMSTIIPLQAISEDSNSDESPVIIRVPRPSTSSSYTPPSLSTVVPLHAILEDSDSDEFPDLIGADAATNTTSAPASVTTPLQDTINIQEVIISDDDMSSTPIGSSLTDDDTDIDELPDILPTAASQHSLRQEDNNGGDNNDLHDFLPQTTIHRIPLFLHRRPFQSRPRRVVDRRSQHTPPRTSVRQETKKEFDNLIRSRVMKQHTSNHRIISRAREVLKIIKENRRTLSLQRVCELGKILRKNRRVYDELKIMSAPPTEDMDRVREVLSRDMYSEWQRDRSAASGVIEQMRQDLSQIEKEIRKEERILERYSL
nr:MAG: wsv079-like protein [Metapenaeus ensis nimavirus]